MYHTPLKQGALSSPLSPCYGNVLSGLISRELYGSRAWKRESREAPCCLRAALPPSLWGCVSARATLCRPAPSLAVSFDELSTAGSELKRPFVGDFSAEAGVGSGVLPVVTPETLEPLPPFCVRFCEVRVQSRLAV